MQAMPILPFAQDKSLHRHPCDAERGRHADGTSRSLDGKPVGTSTFANFTVLIAVAKIRDDATRSAISAAA
jgi:hypothetical protein